MTGCDFTACEFDDVEFIAINMDNVKLPTGPDLLMLSPFPAVATGALAWLRSPEATQYPAEIRRDIEKIIEGMYPELLPIDGSVLVNLKDYRFPAMPVIEEVARKAFDAGMFAAHK